MTAVGALVFTALSLNATRDQVKIAAEGQITERYSRAIEQLGQQGPDRLQIRLGGIYALERLTRDSPRDQPTIIEVLTTFVRDTGRTAPSNKRACHLRTAESPPLSPDVQAALKVLGHRDSTNDATASVDLSRACLDRANLRGANFATANLSESDLQYAKLIGVNFEGANLNYVDLQHADLEHADLVRATCAVASLGWADLADADLTSASLESADLTSTTLKDATLKDARLNNAILINANLKGANLEGAHLTRAILTSANLEGVNLTGANLKGVDLRSVDHDEHTIVDDVQIDDATKGEWW